MVDRYRSGIIYRIILFSIISIVAGISDRTNAQLPDFIETFGNTAPGACDQGNLAGGFVTANGTWTVTDVGINDTAANEWYISATEPGLASGSCAVPGCHINALYVDRTLHIGNVSNSPNAITGTICPTGDCGAVYDPGGFQTAVMTNKRAESPPFTLVGNVHYLLVFNYIENGDYPDSSDNMHVEFYNGSNWVPSIAVPPRTLVSCGTSSVQWEKYFITLPVLGATSNNVKLGFTWKNDNGGVGTSPSVAIDSIIVLTIDTPVANFTVSDTDICVNDCINFFADSAGPVANYNWFFNGASIASSTQQNPSSVCYSNPGTYVATLVVSTSSGIDTATKTIVVNPCMPPTSNFIASDTSFCERSCINFTDMSINGATGWNWFFPGGIPSSSSSPTPPPICYSTPGFYDVTLIAFNQFGSDTLTKTAYLNVNSCPFPIADFNSVVTQLCPTHCVTFNDNSQFGPITSYQWYFAGGTPDTSSAASPSICYMQEGLYDVQEIVTNQYGSDTIVKYSEVSVQFVNGAFACPDTQMYFGSSYQMFAGGGISYSWSPTTGLDSATSPTPIATPAASTVYTVSITDAAGCTSERQVRVTVLHNNGIFVPNSFSPNGDGNNDILFVHGNNIYGLRLSVFDRWGEKVFESTNPSIGWDGTYNGKELDPGVFTYVATINYDNKEAVSQSGTITLIR